jgi:hypothetical protein
MKKILLLLILIYSSSFAVDFTSFALTDNQALNYFFSFPIYVMFTALPFIALLTLFRKV